MANSLRIVVDKRERKVLPFIRSPTEVRTMNMANDFWIVERDAQHGKDVVHAIVERKTLSDYGNSIKDKRVDAQREQMVKRRRRKPALVVKFILEGEFAAPETKFGGIPYSSIMQSLANSEIVEGITCTRTADPEDTARALDSLLKAFVKLRGRSGGARERLPGIYRFVAASAAAPSAEDTPAANAPAVDSENAPAANAPAEESAAAANAPAEESATAADASVANGPAADASVAPAGEEGAAAALERTDISHTLAMWKEVRGVNTIAQFLSRKFAVRDVVCGNLTEEKILEVKYANGRRIGKTVVAELLAAPDSVELHRRFLRNVPQFGGATVAALLNARSLRELLKMSAEDLAELETGKNRLGSIRAGLMLKYFALKNQDVDLSTPNVM